MILDYKLYSWNQILDNNLIKTCMIYLQSCLHMNVISDLQFFSLEVYTWKFIFQNPVPRYVHLKLSAKLCLDISKAGIVSHLKLKPHLFFGEAYVVKLLLQHCVYQVCFLRIVFSLFRKKHPSVLSTEAGGNGKQEKNFCTWLRPYNFPLRRALVIQSKY